MVTKYPRDNDIVFLILAVSFRNMRWDTLGQILSVSGAHAGARILVLDDFVGLVVGALAYRMRGNHLRYGSQARRYKMFDTTAFFIRVTVSRFSTRYAVSVYN